MRACEHSAASCVAHGKTRVIMNSRLLQVAWTTSSPSELSTAPGEWLCAYRIVRGAPLASEGPWAAACLLFHANRRAVQKRWLPMEAADPDLLPPGYPGDARLRGGAHAEAVQRSGQAPVPRLGGVVGLQLRLHLRVLQGQDPNLRLELTEGCSGNHH